MNLFINTLTESNVEAIFKKFRGSFAIDPNIARDVRKIIDDVLIRGDEALVDYTKKLDGVELGKEELRVGKEEFEEAYSMISDEQLSALKLLKERVEFIEKTKLEDEKSVEVDGIKVRYILRPIESVGCYAPAGKARYPSSLLMAAVPALLAGVERIVVCSPPNSKKKIDPLMLVAADLCGIKEYYKVGGAQAIAALAYGTETIEPVVKIVGAGGIYVTAAKLAVLDKVSIDMPAGPSEVIIIADESAKPELIVRDMISQAEHGYDSVCGLVSLSKELAERVAELIPLMLKDVDTSSPAHQALLNKGFILFAPNLKDVVRFVNLFAPEHLEIHTKRPEELVESIKSAGMILLGGQTPVAATDYCIGVNHILPTAGFARSYSGLSVFDFIRRVAVVKCSQEGLRRVSSIARPLAESEGLPNHKVAIEERLRLG